LQKFKAVYHLSHSLEFVCFQQILEFHNNCITWILPVQLLSQKEDNSLYFLVYLPSSLSEVCFYKRHFLLFWLVFFVCLFICWVKKDN
jgi:hypothetical protein